MWAGPGLLGRQLAAEPISPGSGSPCAAHAFSPSPSPQHVCSRPAEGLGHRPAPPGGLLVPVDDGVEEAAVAPAGGEVVAAQALVALHHALGPQQQLLLWPSCPPTARSPGCLRSARTVGRRRGSGAAPSAYTSHRPAEAKRVLPTSRSRWDPPPLSVTSPRHPALPQPSYTLHPPRQDQSWWRVRARGSPRSPRPREGCHEVCVCGGAGGWWSGPLWLQARVGSWDWAHVAAAWAWPCTQSNPLGPNLPACLFPVICLLVCPPV